jgi:hypothetical protein
VRDLRLSWRRRSKSRAWERKEMRTIFWLENLSGRDHLEELEVDERIILKWILGKEDRRLWNHDREQ